MQSILRYSIIALIILFSTLTPKSELSAQSAPNYFGGGQTSYVTSTTPAMVTINPETILFYRDANTGYLSSVQSTNGYTWSNAATCGFPIGNYPISAVVEPNYFNVYVVFSSGNGYMSTLYNVSTGRCSTPTQLAINAPSGYFSTYQAGLVILNNTFYLSIDVEANGGMEIALLSSTDGENYNTFEVPVNLYTTSGSSMTAYTLPGGGTTELALCFTQSINDSPVVALSPDGVNFNSITADNSVQFSGDPSLVAFQQANNSSAALYVFGRTSSNNLYEVATYDGHNFAAPVDLGFQLTYGSANVLVGPYGHLSTAFRSNYGNNIWTYAAN